MESIGREHIHMAEFCKGCFHKLVVVSPCQVNESVILSEDFDLCEGCGEFKQVVIGISK